MKIKGNTIIFNSDWKNYEDEENGKKPNTQRILNRGDAEEVEIWWQTQVYSRKIEIQGYKTSVFETAKVKFTRTLTDVRSVGDLLGHFIFVFSWKHEDSLC